MKNINQTHLDKNEYEASIKQYIDDLDEKITVFEGEINKIEKLSRKYLEEEINRLKLKKSQFEKEAETVKNTETEKWSLVSDEIDRDLQETAKEISKIYVGIKKGFSYMIEKLEK